MYQIGRVNICGANDIILPDYDVGYLQVLITVWTYICMIILNDFKR